MTLIPPRTVDEVHKYVNDRRAGIIKGLTKDVDVYICDPDNPNLSLYSFPHQRWVELPPPSDLHEPKLAIDLLRYTLTKHEWLSKVALQSDEWLYSITVHYATKFCFCEADLEHLLKKFADVPSICEVMEEKAKKRARVEGRGLSEEKIALPRQPVVDQYRSEIADVMVEKAKKRAKVEGRGLSEEKIVLHRQPVRDQYRSKAKANKRAKVIWYLPDDILDMEILPRLPVRVLLRYRSVCKRRRSLIDDPKFVSWHLRSYRNNSEASQLLVMHRPRGWLGDEEVLVRRGDTFKKVQKLKNSYASHNIISYVNGVILVKKGIFRLFREIVLWNPSIDKSLTVPNSMFEAMRDANYLELGLGHDASCNDYKVIAIVYPHAEFKYSRFGKRYRATAPGWIQVYSLGKESWSTKHGVSPPPYWTVGKQVYVNGAIHWINFGPNVTDDSWYETRDSHIVLFDVKNEKFEYFKLPSGLKSDVEPKKKFPTVLSGSFAIFCAYGARHDIWMMTKYGESDSWSKMYTFTLQFDKLLHFKSDGELLFAVFGKGEKGIKSYDVIKKSVRLLRKTCSKSEKYTVYTNVESLVLLKEAKKRSS